MSYDPKDETGRFTVGVVLKKMRAATERQVKEALILQKDSASLLGEILVAEGIITKSQLLEALEAQKQLRSKKKHVRALAAARLAEQSMEHLEDYIDQLEEAVEDTKKRTTGRGHPAITDDMLDE